ncbi:flagellar hook-basal body complex protein [Jannaschia rubra]|uniref:Distal rod protein n=1 Tax=Jannaschia rubra TaxID=282197 RepID=A0A0M6XTA9_9RHOB|nr:flagellar hook-basal body complex protein [Jannaschia rubra]CTQ33234.1 Distal rod protein [Jannaschia rubra]SFF97532.1 flagellar basal-body rod protein FlgF [Jannaschia rubra]
MADGIYPTLGRQAGLLREMEVIAQNIANANTTGYRAEGLIFSEHVIGGDRHSPSVSFAHATGRQTRFEQGGLDLTGGTLDLAIEGEGYFLVDVAGTPHLTRAGSFVAGPDGGVQTAEGHPLLDESGAPVFVPPDARAVSVGADGTVSADGQPIARVAVVMPADPGAMSRRAGTMFAAEDYTPVETPGVKQGFLESSNVNPVMEVARMVAVQNAYQMGQGFMDREHERMQAMLRLMDQ